MALSDKQKADVIFFLGWPGKTLVVDSTSYSRITAQKLENLGAGIESQVENLLDKLKKNDERLESASDRLAAKRVGDIELNEDELMILRNERNRLRKLLSQLIDIPLMGSSGVMFGVTV